MNKIYKVVWSKAKHTYVVASEIAKGHTKGETTGKGLKKLAAAMLVAAALLSPSFAWAADATTKFEPAADQKSTTAVAVYTKDEADNKFATIDNLSAVSTEVQTQAKQVNTNAEQINTNTTNINGLTTRVTALESSKTDKALHISDSGDLIVGTIEKQRVKDMEIRGELTSGSVSTGDITSSGDVTVAGKMAADGVTDETTKDGSYIKQNNTVGNNLVSLDKQVKANDERITNVKEYVLSETNKNYVSKTDAALQDDGAIVKKANTIGENVANLDAALAKETADRLGADAAQDKVIKQVNDNLVASVNTINESVKTTNENMAAGFTALSQADANEVATREAKDNELNERITNEANAIHETTNKLQSELNTETAAREAADTALDSRITNVKEYLEKQTSDKYVSKDDAAVQDGAIVKAANTIGDNVTKLDAALAKETAARIGADKAQDKVIQQVNDNAAAGIAAVNTALATQVGILNQNDATERAERMAADAAETSARVAADTKLVEATNGGLSLDNDNVLQKTKTEISSTGEVTTSKEAATTLIINKKADNQVKIDSEGVTVGTSSTQMDAEGFTAGGHDYDAAGAALMSDGSIKGAKGAFTVDTKGNVISTATVKGATLTDGTATLQNGNLNTTGNVNAHDIVATGDISGKAITGTSLNTQGGSISGGAITGTSLNTQGGSISGGAITGTSLNTQGGAINGGAITGTSINGTTGTFGSLSTTGNASVGGTLTTNGITNNGNATTDMLTVNHNATVGGNLGVTGDITGKSLNVGTGDIKGGQITGTGLNVGAGTIKTTGAVETGTLTTTGNAAIDGNLTVDKNLTVNGEFNSKTLSSKLDENNYTTINGGKTESRNLKIDVKTHETQVSASTFDETGSNAWAKDDDSIGESSMTADKISQSLSDKGDNPPNAASRVLSQNKDNKYEINDSVVRGNQSNVENRTADTTDSQISLKDDSSKVLNKSYITQNLKKVLMGVEEGDNKTTIEQDANNITNTAKNGTIKNDAGKLVNTASDTIANMAGNDITNTSTNGNIANTAANGTISNNAKNLTNTASENITHKAENGNISNIASNGTISNEAKTISNKADEALTNDAKTITNTASESVTTQIGNGSEVQSVMNASGIANKAAGKSITNDAATITNTGTTSVTNQVGENKVLVDTTHVQSAFGDTIYTTWNESGITDKVGENVERTMGTSKITESVKDGTKSNTFTKTVDKDINIVTDGTNTSTESQLAGSVNTSLKNGTQSLNNKMTLANEDGKAEDVTKITDTASGAFSSSSQKADSITNTVKDGNGSNVATDKALSSESKLTSGNSVIDVIKSLDDAANPEITSFVTYGTNTSEVKQTAKDITNTAKNGTITNDAKDLVNNASENMTNTVGKDLTTTVGGEMKTTVTGDSSLSAKNITNTAETIKDVAGKTTVTTTDTGTTFENTAHSTAIEEGTITSTTISGNTLETGKATMDYADVMKDLGVRGSTTLGTTADDKLTVNATSTFNGNVSMTKDLSVGGTTTTDKLVVSNGATVSGGTTTDTLHVTGKSTFDDIVKMNKGLSVTGGVTADTVTAGTVTAGTVTADSYKVGDKTYIDENGINANNKVIRNVGQGDISEGSHDAVSGRQLYDTNTRVSGLETRMGTVETKVDKLDNKIDKVGANAAAMANLHPLEFDEDSKWNIAAAVGSSGSETASAVGVFYRPNENVMVNASAAMGTGENMFGGGVSLRLGHGGNKAKEAQMKAAAKENRELRAKVDDLTARMDALLSVLNPNMSKDFPDVPENHWAYEAVSRLAGNGIVEGYEDGKYHGERQMTRYEMAEIIYNALSKGAKAEKKLVEEFRPELQAMAAQKKA